MAIAFAQVQTFTTAQSFGDLANVTGVQRYSNLVQRPGGTLYGTAFDGLENVRGTAFKLNSDRSGFTAIKWFTKTTERAFPALRPALWGEGFPPKCKRMKRQTAVRQPFLSSAQLFIAVFSILLPGHLVV
jgi:hypothetical protein